MKRFAIILAGFVALVAVVAICYAGDVRRVTTTVTASTNAVATLATTLTDRGVLQRAIIAVSSGGTCCVDFVDSDGTAIWSGTNITGSTTITTAFPMVGLTIKTSNANMTNKTVKLDLTLE